MLEKSLIVKIQAVVICRILRTASMITTDENSGN